MAVVLLVPMLIMGLVLLQIGLGSGGELSEEIDETSSRYLAEAAVAEAVTALRSGGTGGVASQATPAVMGGGAVWVEATPLGGGRYRLLAVALKDKGRSAIEVVVQMTGASRFQHGLASNLSTDLATKLLADSFDSSLGTYASQVPPGGDHAGDEASIASNGDITIGQHSTVFGDAQPGPGGTVDLTMATVTGSTNPAPDLFTMDPVDVPVLPAGGPLTVVGTITLPPGNHRFSSLTLANGAILRVPGQGTVVVDGDVSVGNGGKLELGADAPVEVFIGGNLALGTNSGIDSPSLNTANASLFLTGAAGQEAIIKSHTRIYGTIYAPNADVELGNKFELFGAMAADHVFVKNGEVSIHYDVALTSSSNPQDATFETVSWLPAAFPDPALLRDRRDPFRVLGVHRGDLPLPSEAWDMGTGPGQ